MGDSATALLDDATLAMLADSMRRFATRAYSFEQRGGWLDQGAGYGESVWRDMAGFGWLGLAIPESLGGFGSDPRAVGALMEHAGATLALEPLFASAVLAARVLARCGGARARGKLEGIAAGEIVAFAHTETADQPRPESLVTVLHGDRLDGAKIAVLHGDVAQRLIVSARAGQSRVLAEVDPASRGVKTTRYRLVDGRGAASFEFRDVAVRIVSGEGDVAAAIDLALDDATLALCAETYGAVRALNAMTTEHLKTRQQFGRPLAANQALQHRTVDCFVLAEELLAAVDSAYRAYATPARVSAIAAAAAHAATVGRHCAHEAVQLHGGMGITTATPVSHFFRRLFVTARLMGDRQRALLRFAQR